MGELTGWLICCSVAFSPSSLARTNKQQLKTDIKLNKHLHNTLFALLISIYEFVCHYRVLRGTARAQIDRKHNHKSNNVRCNVRGGEWSFKNSGFRKILVEFHRSCSLVLLTVMSVSQSRFLCEGASETRFFARLRISKSRFFFFIFCFLFNDIFSSLDTEIH